jgi:hypothetical protein
MVMVKADRRASARQREERDRRGFRQHAGCGRVDVADDARGRELQPHAAVGLRRQPLFDQPRAEAAAAAAGDGRAAALAPFGAEPGRLARALDAPVEAQGS